MLVVVAVIAVLMAILLPALGSARAMARSSVCKSNLHQLHLANASYAVENDDYYVPAASDIVDEFGGRHRWHGVRKSAGVDIDPIKNHFNPAKGPLAASLGSQGKVKACPEFVDYEHDGGLNAFEEGTGGYGYNDRGVGSRDYDLDFHASLGRPDRTHVLGMRVTEIANPGATVMFTDSAFTQTGGTRIIEYSFAESPAWVGPDPWKPDELVEVGRPIPSIHFRHRGKANVAWVDGHVDDQPFKFSKTEALEAVMIGWFGPNSNDLFDPL